MKVLIRFRIMHALCALLALSTNVNAQSQAASFEEGACPFWSADRSTQYRVDCGQLIVPESETSRRQYRLQVAILRSLGERTRNDAIVVIPGGPGEEMVGPSAARLARHPLQDTLRQYRDIVLFDPRGVGYSEPGELCPSLTAMDVRLAIVRMSFSERTARMRRELEQCRARLREEGIDVTQFNSVALARDLEHLRRALGYDQLNLIGLSWGTRVALETLRRFPASVRSALLYGPFPPDASTPDEIGRHALASLEQLFQRCAADPACNAEFPSLHDEFTALNQQLEADPIHVDTRWGSIDVDAALAGTALTYGLYDSDFLPYVPLAIRELRRGNASFLHGFLGSALGQGSSGGFYYAAHCYELAPLPVREDTESTGWMRSLDRFAPDVTNVCGAFVSPASDPTVLQPVHSDVPTLIITGEFDPATPPVHGRRIAATLTNARLVELPATGHDVNVPNACTVALRHTFLDNPGGRLDTSCVDQLPQLSFATDVHVNAGVPRLLTHLVIAREPRWIAGIGAVLLSLLLSVARLPALALGRNRDQRPGAVLATMLLWGAAALAVVFAAGLVAVVARESPYVGFFGVPARWAWLFSLPLLVAALTTVSAIVLIFVWKPAWWWTPREGALRILAVAALVAFIVIAYRFELIQTPML